MSPWSILILAGFFEVGFTTMMKLSEGFTKPTYTVGFLFFAISSFFLLNKAMVAIPIGTAYAVWTGIGAFGTALVGMIWFGDPISSLRILFLATLCGSVIGLKFLNF